jgi:hypothetical protein
MNQIAQMFKESNKVLTELNKSTGRIDMENMNARIRALEVQVKMLNSVINIYAVASKNKRMLTSLGKMNVINETSAVFAIGDPELDKVICPYHDNLITRSECLDESGMAENMERCQGCETGIESKRLILPVE